MINSFVLFLQLLQGRPEDNRPLWHVHRGVEREAADDPPQTGRGAAEIAGVADVAAVIAGF